MARDPVFWEWVCTTRQPSVRCEDDTYSIDVFVRAFLTNTCRLLTSGECITLPADPRAIQAVIMTLEEPIQVTIVNIEGDSFPTEFLWGCRTLTSLTTTGLTSVRSIGYQFLRLCPVLTSVDLSGFTSVKSIGDCFLARCPLLTSVDLSGFTSVRSIGR